MRTVGRRRPAERRVEGLIPITLTPIRAVGSSSPALSWAAAGSSGTFLVRAIRGCMNSAWVRTTCPRRTIGVRTFPADDTSRRRSPICAARLGAADAGTSGRFGCRHEAPVRRNIRLVRLVPTLSYRGQEAAGQDHADLSRRQPMAGGVVPSAGGIVDLDDGGTHAQRVPQILQDQHVALLDALVIGGVGELQSQDTEVPRFCQ